jgi:hypothetical protein
MELKKTDVSIFRMIIIGFFAGFVSTLTFHQVTLWVLWNLGLAPFEAYRMAAVPPMGIPAVFSLAFWGGIWGIVFSWIHGSFPRNRYWLMTFLFGAILPTLVAMLVVLPLKGRPMGGGWHYPILMTAFLINGAWGLGTGFILNRFHRQRRDDSDACAPDAICDH